MTPRMPLRRRATLKNACRGRIIGTCRSNSRPRTTCRRGSWIFSARSNRRTDRRMVDYYSALMRAVTAPDAGDVQWRRGMYDRARQLLAARLRERRPPARQAEITAELSALDAAIDRIEAEMSWTDQQGDLADIGKIKVDTVNPEREPIAKPVQLRGTTWLVLAVVVAALGAGGLVFWPHKAQMSAPPATKSVTLNAAPKPAPVAKVATSKDGDLAAGIDGGSSDPDQGYVFRRQSTFYRTLQPVGTVIVDKLQH